MRDASGHVKPQGRLLPDELAFVPRFAMPVGLNKLFHDAYLL
jgi:hypothetical protein